VMYDRAMANPKIEFATFRQVKRFLSDEKGLTGAILEDPRDGSEHEIACTGAFIAIGHKPITAFLDGQLATDDEGYLVHGEHTMTDVSGVFAAGDVVDKRYRQAITAAGQGCAAAIDAERWLEDNEH
jgi:thioredoxin reductase (NADPH)